MTSIKYPRFHIAGQPSDFYVFYQKTENDRAMWSGWIKGDSSLWYELSNAPKKEKEEQIIKLAKISQ